MAKETPAKITELSIEAEKRALEAKKRQFELQGKTFRQDPYGPGVVPDDIYDSLRDPKDPKYRKGV